MATQKMINDKDNFGPKEWTDNLHSIAESQNKLAEAAKTLVGRLDRRAAHRSGQDDQGS